MCLSRFLRLLSPSDRDRYQLGTLSHSLNLKASGYQELSDWPAVAPDQSVRNVEVIEPVLGGPLMLGLIICTSHGSDT